MGCEILSYSNIIPISFLQAKSNYVKHSNKIYVDPFTGSVYRAAV